MYKYVCINVTLQNENVCRASTSERLVQDMRRPDRRTAMRVLVTKTFNFVDNIWQSFVQQRSDELRYCFLVGVNG